MPKTKVDAAQPAPFAYSLGNDQRALLEAWYADVGPRQEDEAYGSLITRVGEHQLDRPYLRHPHAGEAVDFHITLDNFHCVSFVETTIAVARCTWLDTRDEACFVREVKDSRYRNGAVAGYSSRLHYFSDWLDNNVQRERLSALTQAFGGKPKAVTFSYMTEHPKQYPSLNTDALRAQIIAEEARLSELDLYVINKNDVKNSQRFFQDGDLVAIVGDKEGILIKHAGFIYRRAQEPPRMLHASSSKKKVLISPGIVQYLRRRSDRRGVVISRPMPPRKTTTPKPDRNGPVGQ